VWHRYQRAGQREERGAGQQRADNKYVQAPPAPGRLQFGAVGRRVAIAGVKL